MCVCSTVEGQWLAQPHQGDIVVHAVRLVLVVVEYLLHRLGMRRAQGLLHDACMHRPLDRLGGQIPGEAGGREGGMRQGGREERGREEGGNYRGSEG